MGFVKLVMTPLPSSPRRAKNERNLLVPLDLNCHPGTSYRLRKFIQIRVRGQNRDLIEVGGYIQIVSCIVSFARTHAIFRPEKAVVDPIVAELHAERGFRLAAEEVAENRMAYVEPSHPAPVLLFELVALIGVNQVVGEIGEQIEIVIEPVGHECRFGICALVMPFALQAITL